MVHHRYPHLPWFEHQARWRRERDAIVARDPDLTYAGDLAPLRAHAFYPLGRPDLP